MKQLPHLQNDNGLNLWDKKINMKAIVYPPTIKINDKVFVRQEMLPVHDHHLYIHTQAQQQVKVSWSKFYDCYRIEGRVHKSYLNADLPYYISADSLQTEMSMPEQYIDTYFTSAQNEALDKVITETLSKVW